MKKLLIIALLLITSSAFASDKVMIQVRFSEDTPTGKYSDCLYYTPEDWAKLDPKDLEAKKKERVDNWLANIEAAKNYVAPEPTIEDMQKEDIELDRQIAELQQRKVDVATRISAKTLITQEVIKE